LDTITIEKNLNSPPTIDNSPQSTRTLAELPGPQGVPLFGNAFQIDSSRFHQSLESWAHEFGPLYRLRIGRKRILIVADHNLIAALLRDRPDAIRRSTRTANAINELGIRGVFTDEGDEWRKQRKLVMRALTPEVIRSFFPNLVTLTNRLQKRWQDAIDHGRPVDILRDLKAYALDVTIGLAMGQDINALENEHEPLQRDIEFIFSLFARRVTAPFAYWHYFKLPVDHAADKCVTRIRDAITGFIAQARKNLEKHPERRLKPTNMMEALIAARDEPDSGFTDDHVIGNAITMVFAGEDTTSNTIAWLLSFAAGNDAVTSNLVAETDAVLQEGSILDDFGLLDRLAYLEASATEAMRLKPVAPLLGLETIKDVMLGDVLVPQGTVMLACMRIAALQDEHFAQADAFLPDRWLQGNVNNLNNDSTRKIFPFGGGPRFCPGRFLAMTEIKMVTSMVMRNFAMTLDQNAPPVEERFTFTMHPSALPIRFSKRSS
jgi:cytochrome P450